MHAPSASCAERHKVEMADIVRAHGAALSCAQRLLPEQQKALAAIARCRTSALGGHLDVCRSCGHSHPSYNSCRNRHCPKCQALAQMRWVAAREARILPVKHFHVVFTLPSELRRLALYRREPVFDALFRAAAETLLELGHTRLGADLGVTTVLHTWTRDLRFHPHAHCIVPAGGLARDGSRWIAASAKYLFPVKVMGALFRGKMMCALRALYARGVFAGFDDFRDPDGFDHLLRRLARIDWVVYAKKPFGGAHHVYRYLGRYTHRVGIANSRLVSADEDAVTFRTKNAKTITVTPVEFLRRFVMHILPHRYVKIRHYGLHASGNVLTKLAAARAAIAKPDIAASAATPTTWIEWLLALTGRDVRRCPVCGGEITSEALAPLDAPAAPDTS